LYSRRAGRFHLENPRIRSDSGGSPLLREFFNILKALGQGMFGVQPLERTSTILLLPLLGRELYAQFGRKWKMLLESSAEDLPWRQWRFRGK